MLQINVLTNNRCPNSKAFNCPLLASRRFFAENHIELSFFFGFAPEVFNADIIFVNSNVFREFWQSDLKPEIFRFLEKARERHVKIFWFDTTDSTMCTQFEVLPYVDLFLKGQILKDRTQYLTPPRTGRVFTDYFDKLYNSNEYSTDCPVPEADDLNKIVISWNSGFENYNASRYGFEARLRQRLKPYFWEVMSEEIRLKFKPVDNMREIKASCRVGYSHSRQSVIDHRKAIVEIMEAQGVDCGKVPLKDYFHELENCRLGIGPFGVGEITLRDYEIIICGAVLVKPDMGHLETYPDFFQSWKTYVPHRWDLSDFESVTEKLYNQRSLRVDIAANAQKVYREAVSEAGMRKFFERLEQYIIRVQTTS
jgi:hypothetical protein